MRTLPYSYQDGHRDATPPVRMGTFYRRFLMDDPSGQVQGDGHPITTLRTSSSFPDMAFSREEGHLRVKVK